MRAVGSWQLAVGSWFGRLSCLLLCAFCLLACSVPNLEPAECDQARDPVREFYSYHFGNNLGFSEDELNKRREYLTPGFLIRIRDAPRDVPPGVDPFTREEDPPKAFRVGECKVLEPGKRTSFEVLLFWKNDVRSEQRTVRVELANLEGKWLIDRVSKNAETP